MRSTSRATLRSIFLLLVGFAVQAPPCDAGATITVNSVADAGGICPGATCTLRQAIASAAPGDTIDFAPNIGGPIALTSGELLLDKSITIVGPGANILTVRRSIAPATPYFRIFNIASNVNAAISGLTIANGYLENLGFLDQRSGAGVLVDNGAQLQLSAVTISGNQTNTSAGAGGGLANLGTMTITASTLSGNSSNLCGGGIVNTAGTLNVINSTIAGNYSLHGGGGLCNKSTTTLTSSTVVGNAVFDLDDIGGNGGGIDNLSGTVTARNTIIAQNSADFHLGPDVYGTLTSQGFNLIGNNADAVIAPSQPADQIGTAGAPIDPLLGPLQDNGGPTPTMAPLSNSPAIDKGHSSGLSNDQRGARYFRPIDLPGVSNASSGDGADIGAIEFVSIDIDGNGAFDPSTDGLLILRYLLGNQGMTLTDGAIGQMATRTLPDEVLAYLLSIRPVLDVDLNGQFDALTDGLMLYRYLQGIRQPALTSGAVGAGATLNGAQIETFIQSLTR